MIEIKFDAEIYSIDDVCPINTKVRGVILDGKLKILDGEYSIEHFLVLEKDTRSGISAFLCTWKGCKGKTIQAYVITAFEDSVLDSQIIV